MPAKSQRLVEKEKIKKAMSRIDGPTIMIVLLLLGTGLVVLFTASYSSAYYSAKISSPLYYVVRQGAFALVGIAFMFVISKIDYHKLHLLSIPFFVVALILLIAVPFIGREINQAKRWIYIGGVSVQPSEIMKTAVIVCFSSFATIYHDKIRTLKYGVMPYMLALGLIAVLLKLEPHLSATIIIIITGLAILFVAGIKIWYFFPIVGVGAIGAYWYVMNHAYALTRLKVWLDPWIDYRGKGWQAAQSFIAIGSGGLWGLGLGQGRQKHLYLPEPANDFIFSVACEELGFIGAFLIIIMFAYLIYRGFYISRNSKDKFGCLLATGITTKIAVQTLVNLCVVSGVMPVTGASLPFFSYGGTSLLIQLAEIGVLLNISRQMKAGSLE